MSGLTAVAMSGGVDSSVAAIELHRRGEHLVGVSHAVVDPLPSGVLEGFRRAEALCRRLRVPYLRLDVSREFRIAVLEDFARTYLAGRTPNPCIICNSEIKFGVFRELVRRRAIEEGLMDDGCGFRFATGHYARIGSHEGLPVLLRGVDRAKDQSYMLYRLGSDRLASVEFPLGARTKQQVVRRAREMGLEAAQTPESQDACFVVSRYTDVIADYVGNRLHERGGEIVDTAGRVLGTHHGYVGFTVGQRRGLGLGNGPWYVVEVDAAANRVVVGRRDQAASGVLTVGRCVWYVPEPQELECTCKVRYQSMEVACSLRRVDAGVFTVTLAENRLVTAGQSAVFYAGERVLGGGIIERPMDRQENVGEPPERADRLSLSGDGD